MSVLQAKQLGLTNYSILVSHVRVPPAIKAILSSPTNRVQGFLLAGHVCAVMGYHEYPPLASQFITPMVVTGFEPLDIVQGILTTVQLLEGGKMEVGNAYSRAVTFEGNQPAQKAIAQVFETVDRKWRGIGTIPQSGWGMRAEFADFDVEKRFDVQTIQDHHYYSVPYQLIHEQMHVRLTATSLEILFNGRRVAMHCRSYRRGGYTTLPDTGLKPIRGISNGLPPASSIGRLRSALKPRSWRPRSWNNDPTRSRDTDPVWALLRLGKTNSPERLEAACSRALEIKAYSYKNVESILKKGLDRQPCPCAPPQRSLPLLIHENLRGKQYYQ